VSRIGRLLAFLFLFRWARRRRRREERERVVPEAPPARGAEIALVVLLLLAALCAVAFVVFYATGSLSGQTQLQGLSLGLCFAFVAAAFVVVGRGLVVTEELEEDYPEPEHREEQEEIAQLVEQSGSRFTRKGLVKGAAGVAGGAIGAALLAPVASLGPFLKTRELQQTPWGRGRRLVDEKGRPWTAADIELGTFYTAYPEGASHDLIGAPVVLVRLAPNELKLPASRRGWDADGIVAYSKVCTHAGCAIALYRKPTFPPVEPRPALVCPCHYSTFDPGRAGKVLFGPAGRPLPQLPLRIGSGGELQAAGNFSGPVGPSWWGVRNHGARSS
jgi:ubiquinol-cytochrome c reductase iron-sulfur subunit